MTPTPNNFKGQDKDNQKPVKRQELDCLSRYQNGRLIIALHEARQPLNMRQLSTITGIERPTMCRRMAELREMGFARLVRYGICPISKYPRVGYFEKGKRNG